MVRLDLSYGGIAAHDCSMYLLVYVHVASPWLPAY